MIVDGDSTDWKKLHQAEAVAREEYLETVNRFGPDSSERRELARRWWATVESLLRVYARAIAYNRQHELQPEPATLLWALHGMAGHLAVGHIPGPMSDVVGRGTAAIGPMERLHIGWATGYLILASQNQIDDAAPVRTVMQHFGVKRQTVQRWARLPLPEDVRVALPHSDAVAFHMKSSGLVYRKFGRSTKALEARHALRGIVWYYPSR